MTATDDVAIFPERDKGKTPWNRSGVFMWKTAGAKAAMGADLDEVIELALESSGQH